MISTAFPNLVSLALGDCWLAWCRMLSVHPEYTFDIISFDMVI